jgi:hypothetical protein
MEENKLKSRKLIFTIIWNLFVIVGLIVSLVTKRDIIPYMEKIVFFAGSITVAYVGIQGYIDGKK